MDKQRILIMNLSKGKIGEDNSKLLGALLITKLQLAAMSRVDIPEEHRKDFYLYVDEFQNFATESFTNILSEARKYRLNLILGHQYITQMEETVRDAVFGNVGTLAVFRVGAEDAEFLEKEFNPEFTAVDLCNLPKYNIYIKLMIDGIASHPFSAETLPPPILTDVSNKDKIIKASQGKYGVKSEIVQERISSWAGFLETEKPPLKQEQNIKKEIEPPGKVKAVNSDNQLTLYDAVCSMCQKPTKVVFEPEQGRPIYCKSCLKKIRSGEGRISNVKMADTLAPQKADKIKNIPFHNPKNQPQKPTEEKPKRKEINLSELKKALEESLEKKDESDEPEETEKMEEFAEKKENELDKQKKGVIQPGQIVKF